MQKVNVVEQYLLFFFVIVSFTLPTNIKLIN